MADHEHVPLPLPITTKKLKRLCCTYPSLKKHFNNTLAFLGAIAGSAELYNVVSVLLRCGFGVEDTDRHISLSVSLSLALILQIPSETFLFKKHSLFAPHDHSKCSGHSHHHTESSALISHSHKKCSTKKIFGALESIIDWLAAGTDAGLAFFSLAEFLKDFYAPSYLKWIFGSILCPPRLLTVCGLNRAHSLSDSHNHHHHTPSSVYGTETSLDKNLTSPINEEKNDDRMHLTFLGWHYVTIGFAGIIAAFSHGTETAYESLATIRGLAGNDDPTCQNQWLDFNAVGNALAYTAIGILALSMAFKTGLIEGMHVKKAHEKHGGFANWAKKTFNNILMGIGNLLASLIHALPAAAAIAIAPGLSTSISIALIVCVPLLDGLVGTFVHGHYWQKAIEALREILISCCCGNGSTDNSVPLLEEVPSHDKPSDGGIPVRSPGRHSI